MRRVLRIFLFFSVLLWGQGEQTTAPEEQTAPGAQGGKPLIEPAVEPAIEPVSEQTIEQASEPPASINAVYVSYWKATQNGYIDNLIKNSQKTPINAVVVDVKNEYGNLLFISEEGAAAGLQKLKAFVAKFKKNGFYTVARFVVFKDKKLAASDIDLAVVDELGLLWIDTGGMLWSDPFSPRVRQYNADLAVLVAKAGFDEIQFDYLRFPANQDLRYLQKSTQKSRVGAIADFLSLASGELKPFGVKISADVFGYTCLNAGDTGIGQDLSSIDRFVDYISPMLYPSGYGSSIPGLQGTPVENPHDTVYLSLLAANKLKKISRAKLRPWIQGFQDYAFDKRKFQKKEIQDQIQATKEFGANGWMLWHPGSKYNFSYLN